MTEMQSILCREVYMLLLPDRNSEHPMQRSLYASASWQKCRASYAGKFICFYFMTEIQSILCREVYMLLLYDRNAENPIQRSLYASAS